MAKLKFPKNLADRYKALEDHRKRHELTHFRRRELAVRDALNHRMELERLTNLINDQRLASLHHTEHRRQDLKRMINRVKAGEY